MSEAAELSAEEAHQACMRLTNKLVNDPDAWSDFRVVCRRLDYITEELHDLRLRLITAGAAAEKGGMYALARQLKRWANL